MKRFTILIADDEAEIAKLIALNLQKEGYQTIIASDGKEAIHAIQTRSIDLAILDIMMPKLNGYEVTLQIREKYTMPIIFLSAKASDMDKISGLVMGADDYMTKPFNPMELVARVKAQLRRFMMLNQPATANNTVLEVKGLVISPEHRTVNLYGERIELTPKEFDILYLLARHPKKVYSAENIFQQVWGEAYYESGNTVMVHIRTLRKSLEGTRIKTSLSRPYGAWGTRSMTKMIRSFRFKMIVLLGASMLLSGTITYLLYKALQLYYRINARYEDPLYYTHTIIRKIGDVNFFLIIFIPLAILFFFLLTKRYAIYFKEISNGIHHLANGDFHSRVEISANDEFGDIAKDINGAAEKLQQAVERGDFAESSKHQLILNLAHDLRTPLTSVIGYLDFILKDEHLTNEQIKHYTNIAFSKSQRLERLIDELFEITRMNYGRLSIVKKPIDLSELLAQLIEELYPAFEKNRLTARLNVSPQLPIRGDGELLARVFENLLTNAIRYGNDGQFVDINGYMDAEGVVIQVVNYGDFIPPEELPYIFDMFFTSDKARTHEGGSTGLGLFIAKNIVEQHNGTISAQSSIVRTLFEVRLPQEYLQEHSEELG